MVRIIDGSPINPLFIIGGWVISILLIVVLFRLKPEFSNDEIAEYATLGAIVFVVQSVFIPFKFILPVFFSLSGIPLVITIKGVRQGLIIATPAIILNHIIIPGSLSMLGINLTNMLFSGLIAGLIPSLIYKNMGRRVRYLSGFIGGILYFLSITILVSIEFLLSVEGLSVTDVLYFVLTVVFILGIIEGFLTAIGSSYYHTMRNYVYSGEINQDTEDLAKYDEDDDIEKIDFLR